MGKHLGVPDHVGDDAVLIRLMGGVLRPAPDGNRIALPSQIRGDRARPDALWNGGHAVDFPDGLLESGDDRRILGCRRRGLHLLNLRDLDGDAETLFYSIGLCPDESLHLPQIVSGQDPAIHV